MEPLSFTHRTARRRREKATPTMYYLVTATPPRRNRFSSLAEAHEAARAAGLAHYEVWRSKGGNDRRIETV